jgi:hypothetical protein
MASLYSTKVTASGGRHGSIRSEDGLLDLKLALPRALGGRGDATNPEQLFAGGYAALCLSEIKSGYIRDAIRRGLDGKRIRPALFTVRDRGASLSKAKCVRVSL